MKAEIRIQKKNALVIALMVVGLFFLPTNQTHAGVGDWFGIGNFAYSAVLSMTTYFAFLFFSILGQLIGYLVTLLYIVINIPVYPEGGLAVIDESWKIMRNFANMFFIVALIIMAFATIFNISKYEARSLFPKFLISAILINFSLVLGVLVIQGSQVLSNTFLLGMGDFSARLGESFINSSVNGGILPTRSAIDTLAASSNAIEGAVFGTLIKLMFGGVLFFTLAFSLLTAAIFALIRIPILWILLVVSPVAWILNVFPTGQDTFRKWWRVFIGWNMFLPIFLFFLYFGLYFLQNQGEVMEKIAAQTKDNVLPGGLTIQTLFYYVLASIFLIGGTMTAMKASMFAGTGVVQAAKWSRGVAARQLRLTAAGTAARQRLSQIQEEGLPGGWSKLYGGKYGLDQQTGKFAQRFGVRGADIKTQKAFVDMASKSFQDFERQYQNGKITKEDVAKLADKYKADDPRGYAYRRLAAKIGQLDENGTLFSGTLRQLSKNPLAAEDFVKAASEGKFSKMKGKDLRRMMAAESGPGYDYSFLRNSVAARREMARYVMTDKKAMSALDDSQIEAGLNVFGGHTTAEGRNFLKEVGKINPEFSVGYNLDAARNPDLAEEAREGFNTAHGRMPAPGPAGDFELKTHMYGGSLRSGDIKDVAGMKKSVFETSEFRESLKIYISQFSTLKARTNFVQRLERSLLDMPGGDQKWNLLRNGDPARGIPVTIGLNYANPVMAPRRPLVPPTGVTPPLG